MSSPSFPVSPEERASMGAFFKRQLRQSPPVTSRSDVQLDGKTAIVTGANSGIGFECSRQLLGLGLRRLVIAARSASKGEAAKDELQRQHPRATIEVWTLDLDVYQSIVDFAERAATLDRLDIVVHNAGMVLATQQHNQHTGHDELVQVNYLAAALLTMLLLPVLKAKSQSGPARLVIVSSDVASWSALKEKESTPMLPAFAEKQKKFDPQDRYAASKLLGQLFLVELARRMPASYGVVVNLANPGLCHGTGLNRDSNGTVVGFLFGLFKRIVGYSCAVGARQLVDAAVNHGAESHGQYLEVGQVVPMAPIVYSDEGARVADRLWKETIEELSFAGVEDIVKQISI